MESNDRDVRIENKLDKISDQISEINVILASQHVSLVEHIRRTNILEDKIVPLEEKLIESKGLMKLGGILGGLLAAAVALAELIGYLRS
jgi:hypothetical protein